ncbi:sporulation histidine kinase inhibitor Sda [Sutcliffiella cohnii]|uniref:Reverse transcriptase domain-containing protein n=1 Tax=Sutcliffiella cohnii TaxID=33932 RepID=A0A223KMD5_9BACI|nr:MULTISPECIES: sporulation histidine kinase inhibitor Sda [Sutcliffiella]AST90669.1 hypothetical protein BC6307_04910 [Sutcliffiella cohnii]MED4016956.1 sporulation histidine kinase inhibitor Sda [Sutcliffiella cohnii]WBL16322.1 sporulation histidine kinase inhibitor Sda [Sutcliffiella sp. NC1]
MKNKKSQYEVYSIFHLSDDMLLTTLHKAMKLQLDESFIEILMKEVNRRQLSLSIEKMKNH